MKQMRMFLTAACMSAVGVLFLHDTVAAQNDDVANTLHNLSVGSGGTDPTGGSLVDYGEICVYCHTPHAGQVDAPLWNRSYPTGPYQMYSSATIDMSQINPGTPTGISLACLSCHDGTIAIDVITNPPNGYSGPAPDGTNFMPVGSTNLGTDLRNDHPVSVTYDNSVATGDPAFFDASAVIGAGLKLFGPSADELQCASCHNPHDNTTAQPFLRISNGSSALCKTCHIK